MRKNERNRGEVLTFTWVDGMGRLLRGGILAGVLTLVGLLIGAACITYGLASQGQMTGIVLGSCVASTFWGGILAIGPQGSRSIPMGIGVGVILFLLCIMGGILVYGYIGLGSESVGVLCACLCGGTMAGILRRKRKKKNKR